jgi:DNA-binding transcriptional ArsR family regulator
VKRSHQQTALTLKALAEPRRIEILKLLKRAPRFVADLVGDLGDEVGVTQQAASQHLALLDKAGLVQARREGTRTIYAVRPEGFAPVEAFVREFWEPRLAALKAEIEKKR